VVVPHRRFMTTYTTLLDRWRWCQ